MTDRKKLIRHAKKNYASSPIEFTDAELDVIEKDDYECSCCRTSVFDMYDYPAIRDGHVYCEDCFIEQFYETCPICENHYKPEEGGEEYFFLTPRTAKITRRPVGMYRVLEHPFFHGDCVSGFDDFFDGAIEQVNDFDIEAYLRQKRHDDDVRIDTEIICPDCARKYIEIAKTVNK